ncbi:MAG: nuclear transport factor 2 family protein [Pseudomonadota bacterium]|nr:nuclear transport factor 2 family protein [Pseudomonadota bacterium]
MTDAALVRDFYATWNPDHLADDVEWRLAEGFPSAGDYRGRRAVFEDWWPRHAAIFPEWQARVEHVVDGGEAVVVVLGTYTGRAAGSDTRFEVPFAHAWRIRDGKIAAFDQHTNTLAFHRILAASDGEGRG